MCHFKINVENFFYRFFLHFGILLEPLFSPLFFPHISEMKEWHCLCFLVPNLWPHMVDQIAVNLSKKQTFI
jgi:hypothetical protein